MIRTIVAAAAIAMVPNIGTAGEAWDDISSMMFDDRTVVKAAAETLVLNTPYRATDDRRVQMGGIVTLMNGAMIDKVYLVIDENPMPVSAVFEMDSPTSEFSFEMSMRLNGPGGIHLVVETTDGDLIMREGFTKTSGLGACAAPPATDPVIALQTLGQMELALAPATDVKTRLASLSSGTKLSSPVAKDIMAEIAFRHPSHSGLQMDQITLLYLPARFIETIAFSTDDQPMFTMTGSISLSEDPALSVALPAGSTTLKVKMIDTEDAAFEQVFYLGQS
jgi:sulfur-oxidizing protein SoxY